MSVSATTSTRPDRLLNREVSWLAYNGRVLELAEDASLPLLERVRLCRYFSSNLDEFFMVRVAGLLDQAESSVAMRSPDGQTPAETLDEVRRVVLELTARQSRLWRRSLQPALSREGIVVGDLDDCAGDELEELERRFEREIYPVLTPLAVGPGQPFPYISGLSLSLGVIVREPESGEERFARVKVPEMLPRFLPVGERGLLVPLERVIRHFLPWLFNGMEIVQCCFFRVTRDADFEISDEADDLLEAVEVEVRRRRFGEVVRLEVAGSVSKALLGRLQRGLRVGDDETYLIRGPLDLADLEEIAGIDRPDLKFERWVGAEPARFAAASRNSGDLFAVVRSGDVLVHHPYDSFASTFETFVMRAASDPDVVALKTTVYRTSEESPLVPALIRAAESGKQSVCLVELKARFDERRNIEWSRALERAGVHVVFGFPNLKIHAKATLVVRREGDELVRYAHVGTGNYHSVTARAYEDFGLFTADPDITADIAELFNDLTGFAHPRAFRKILVAPLYLRDRLLELIAATGEAAAEDKRARIRIKVNNLNDPALVDALYAASQAGAEIDIVARSICTLRPGVKGLSENIRVRSVLGRFLEHSRVLCFEIGDETTYLLGSADLMPRNLDHRIEVVVPAEDEEVRGQLDRVYAALLEDNTTAWQLRQDGSWTRLSPKKGEEPRPAQFVLREARADSPRTSARLATEAPA